MIICVGSVNITKHLKNIFASGELQENSVRSILEHTADDGKKYSTKFYNLDAIISVGYRVNSTQATHFRIWATQVLKEYIIKGFAMNDERLKNPDNIFGKDYFEEQLARRRQLEDCCGFSSATRSESAPSFDGGFKFVSPVDFLSKRLYIVSMKEIETIKETIERHKQEIADKYHISEIGVFGSYTRGEQDADSDVDILVSFDKPIGFIKFMRLEFYLSDLLKKKVRQADLFTNITPFSIC